MASEKLILFFLLFLASWASTTLSQDDQGVKPCITKLMPCVDFLHSGKRPSSVCCMALKNELENDVGCLCELLGDDKALKAFNVMLAEVIQFPTRCGLHPADVGKCKKSGDVPMPPVIPRDPSTPPKSPTKG
ncbi:non-specific lipid transfer protein GPI-anchored 8-like [Phoenix dactylifera]|uniref:Non-specific lipid transfer protein GPI-anchored 8-like n=1 Tax=Phoenix dactylifera TaxID=42345 RepID=A0A8B8JC25_PHODC|nr:non-specific lipid transfer protein GPI-anchored 8-like [Phoenix dactylifera]